MTYNMLMGTLNHTYSFTHSPLWLTFSSQLTPPPSDPPSNAPWFFNRLRRYISSLLTYLLTILAPKWWWQWQQRRQRWWRWCKDTAADHRCLHPRRPHHRSRCRRRRTSRRTRRRSCTDISPCRGYNWSRLCSHDINNEPIYSYKTHIDR